MGCPPNLILKHLISSVVSLAQLVSPSVALPAELVQTMVGTLHRLRVENPYGRVGGSFKKYYHFVAPSCKLGLARFSAWLRIQDGAESGNNVICTNNL